MYTVYFIIGFMSSFGWWSAGKIQKEIDKPPVVSPIPVDKAEKIN
jgi:hypothetical protein